MNKARRFPARNISTENWRTGNAEQLIDSRVQNRRETKVMAEK